MSNPENNVINMILCLQEDFNQPMPIQTIFPGMWHPYTLANTVCLLVEQIDPSINDY